MIKENLTSLTHGAATGFFNLTDYLKSRLKDTLHPILPKE
ncbi:protein of unknown function [Maridesulfovibrio hydrothermalis AM13 = DSM 14728]|uniref:Uncharacterized protein n=1 Tax=Maridesulfovibrio hydrothermalis AM13 = DSM 14728 TaxID=1121451 RepID=L0RBY5_9BACT|nr:protein of unknown function [Maridesulfovibrio hydrothermalis AM13 = DSM 14728]